MNWNLPLLLGSRETRVFGFDKDAPEGQTPPPPPVDTGVYLGELVGGVRVRDYTNLSVDATFDVETISNVATRNAFKRVLLEHAHEAAKPAPTAAGAHNSPYEALRSSSREGLARRASFHACALMNAYRFSGSKALLDLVCDMLTVARENNTATVSHGNHTYKRFVSPRPDLTAREDFPARAWIAQAVYYLHVNRALDPRYVVEINYWNAELEQFELKWSRHGGERIVLDDLMTPMTQTMRYAMFRHYMTRDDSRVSVASSSYYAGVFNRGATEFERSRKLDVGAVQPFLVTYWAHRVVTNAAPPHMVQMGEWVGVTASHLLEFNLSRTTLFRSDALMSAVNAAVGYNMIAPGERRDVPGGVLLPYFLYKDMAGGARGDLDPSTTRQWTVEGMRWQEAPHASAENVFFGLHAALLSPVASVAAFKCEEGPLAVSRVYASLADMYADPARNGAPFYGVEAPAALFLAAVWDAHKHSFSRVPVRRPILNPSNPAPPTDGFRPPGSFPNTPYTRTDVSLRALPHATYRAEFGSMFGSSGRLKTYADQAETFSTLPYTSWPNSFARDNKFLPVPRNYVPGTYRNFGTYKGGQKEFNRDLANWGHGLSAQLRWTKNLRFLDGMCAAITKAFNAMDTRGSPESYASDGFLNWIYGTGAGQDLAAMVGKIIELEAGVGPGGIMTIALSCHVNADLVSPGGFNYAATRDRILRWYEEHHIPAWAAYWNKNKGKVQWNRPLDVKKMFSHPITSEICGRFCHAKIRGGANFEVHPSYKMAEEAWALWWNTTNGTVHIYDASDYHDAEMKARFPRAAVWGQRTRGWSSAGGQFAQESGYLKETYAHLMTLFLEDFKPFTRSMMNLVVGGCAVGVHNRRWFDRRGGGRTMLDAEANANGVWVSRAFKSIPIDPAGRRAWNVRTSKAARTPNAILNQPGLPLGPFDDTGWCGDFLRNAYNAASAANRRGMLYAPAFLGLEEVFKNGRRN